MFGWLLDSLIRLSAFWWRWLEPQALEPLFVREVQRYCRTSSMSKWVSPSTVSLKQSPSHPTLGRLVVYPGLYTQMYATPAHTSAAR